VDYCCGSFAVMQGNRGQLALDSGDGPRLSQLIGNNRTGNYYKPKSYLHGDARDMKRERFQCSVFTNLSIHGRWHGGCGLSACDETSRGNRLRGHDAFFLWTGKTSG